LQHASADAGMIFTALNLRRILKIPPKNVLQAYLRGLARIFGQLFALKGFNRFDLPNPNFPSHQSALFFVPRLQLVKMRYFRW